MYKAAAIHDVSTYAKVVLIQKEQRQRLYDWAQCISYKMDRPISSENGFKLTSLLRHSVNSVFTYRLSMITSYP